MMKGKIKFGLILLSSLCLFLSFGYCDLVSDKINLITSGSFVPEDTTKQYNILQIGAGDDGTYCISLTGDLPTCNSTACYFAIGFTHTSSYNPANRYSYYSKNFGNFVCLNNTNSIYTSSQQPYYLNIRNNSSSFTGYTIYYEVFKLDTLLNTDITCSSFSDCPSCPSCPSCPTCQDCSITESLLESCSIDLQACLSGAFSGSSWSALFVNDIQHVSAPIINVSIPEEISRDYTGDENRFDLYVEGYNVDTEYIQSIINVQNYKPSSEDFTNLVGLLAPYTKYLVFLLFVFIIWAWVKKSFKSKKL